MGHQHTKLQPQQLDELAAETKFTHEELKQWYAAFVKDCPSGRLSREQFTKIYRDQFPAGDASKFAEHIFATFDTDADGTVNFKEFICALSVTSRGTVGEKLDWAFNLYDRNKNGFIERNEMIEIVSAIYKMVGQSADHPADEETPEQRVDKIFNSMDKNRDGKLSREEFVQGASKDQSIISALTLCERHGISTKAAH